jgi:hypothetical protein
VVSTHHRGFASWSAHWIRETIFPATPDGKMDQEVSLYSVSLSLGQVVWVQSGSTVGVKGIPLRETEYVAVPSVTGDPGIVYAIQRLTLSPATGVAG